MTEEELQGKLQEIMVHDTTTCVTCIAKVQKRKIQVYRARRIILALFLWFTALFLYVSHQYVVSLSYHERLWIKVTVAFLIMLDAYVISTLGKKNGQ